MKRGLTARTLLLIADKNARADNGRALAQGGQPAEVLRLPRQDRVRVAEELFVSLGEPDEDVVAAWAGELESRSRDLAAGRVRTVPWEMVRARIMNELEQRRAGRASSWT